ncbi:MAG: inorganic diphosphatase [Coriobacteriia bacterium]|nr:inorganic diphosphatase [Coriobacteriia bacterium]
MKFRALWSRKTAIIAIAALLVTTVPAIGFALATHSTKHTHIIRVTHAHSHTVGRTHTHKFGITDPTKKKPTPTLHYTNAYTLKATYDFQKADRKNADGTYNVAVEIPAGTSQKWETSSTATTNMFWEFKNGAPRIVKYLPYVGNYGSLVNSKAADGDPLDVLVLGPAVARGTIQKVKIIGVMNILDGTDADDKLLAVVEGDPMGAVNSLSELDTTYPGVSTIVKTWFENYKGPGEMTFQSWGDAAAAKTLADTVPNFN